LLSCLAYWGADELGQAQAAFAAGAQQLEAGGRITMASLDQCGLERLHGSLDVLATAAPLIKRRVLEACAACVARDGRVTQQEAELLRAIGDSLDCPIPPFLAPQPA
jgi:hypothetical protein